MPRSLFIFRRDLRLEDNTGLIEAMRSSKEVVPCFIFDPAQVGNNEYKSGKALQFMVESLRHLEKQLEKKGGRLFLFCGKPERIVADLIDKEEVNSVFVGRDYTPFSRMRDERIMDACRSKNVSFRSFGDCLLNEPETVLKKDGKPYSVFTHFYNRSLENKVRRPQNNDLINFYRKEIAFSVGSEIYEKISPEINKGIAVRGGRRIGLKILENIGEYEDYAKTRDYPSKSTTMLSAHLKFGTLSVREVYQMISKKLGTTHPLLRQLYWRDFFTYIGHHFPKVFGSSFHEKYDRIKWSYDKENFMRWCEGLTGFPIVDAGMRELNETGFMHNRVRMITASFLTKDLHIDWRWGEKYFAQKLVDYDPCVNNGNWQWSASTGCDAQPYFRIFSPWLQQKKYDPDCGYIKKWVPELRKISSKEIHNLLKTKSGITSYPAPIVYHPTEASLAKAAFRTLK
jgi:deoxyribodipyrimidine photo-lyase